jgi:NTP pyrophosphatase (non-canonical NTP hydrolase)
MEIYETLEELWQDKSIPQMQQLVKEVNEANGWFDSERTFGDDMALLHSEVSEAFEAYRKHHVDDMTQQMCNHEAHTAKGSSISHLCKPEGVGSELADVLVRLLDTCERYNIDLEDEFNRKLRYNATRGYRHGNRLV